MKKLVAFLFISMLLTSGAYSQTSDWVPQRKLIYNVFNEIWTLDAFAFVLPLHCKMETFLSATNKSEIGYFADYILVYTPAKAQVTNVWFLIENDRLTEKARIIGKGGRIEYLRPDLYDAPGFDANDHRESVPTGLFPQRRVQSSKQLKADFCLFLNGKGDSPTYEYLQGNKGWHILRHEKEGEVQITSLFDSGKALDLLEIGKKPEQ